ncbi:AMP-binding protein [Rhodococcus sp. IEGM 1379]|uniref:AMP-binding protein n=1 Tax=Rhodococcus sp. IEGM 1379 TaxID=3047086 RepID=UPI0032D57949
MAGNRAEAWCIGAAAHASGIATSWLHPMGSFDDQMFQIRNAEVDGLGVDERHHGERAGQLAAACVDDVTAVFSFGPCDFACDLEDVANSVGSSRAIERERSNFTLLAPSMIYSMLDDPAIGSADLSSLELILYGASPMSPSRLMEGLDRVGPVFSQLYGQAECCPIALLKKPDHDSSDPDLLSSCGFPLSPFTVSVRDTEGQEVPTGELGEVCVRNGQPWMAAGRTTS